MNSQKQLILFFIVIFFIAQTSCTKNPLFNDETITPEIREIKGTVTLDDRTEPSNIYIWLEGFNLHTRTDSEGNFSISLPQPGAQPGGGLDGSFDLYFYLANYRVHVAQIIVQNGKLWTEEGDLNEDGEIFIQLVKLLDINTTVEPNSIRNDFEGSVKVTVHLFAPREPVIVTFPRTLDDELGTVLLQDNKNSIYPIDYEGNGIIYALIKDSTRSWYFTLDVEPNRFPVGDYLIIPYLLVQHDNIPADLIQSLGDDVMEFGENYLNIPFKRNGGVFFVVPGG